MTATLAGVFVGGAAVRMGGLAKGLLRAPEGVPIVHRWRTILDALGVGMVLVGGGASYAQFGLEQLADAPPGIGPLGGLVSLLRRAGSAQALALACDMPFVSAGLVERVLRAHPGAIVVAPKRSGRWEPLCARYDAARVLPLAASQAAAADHSLQRLLDQSRAVEIVLSAAQAEELRDWDTPRDMES
jgi:molybdopterin-guanine dinucleotide biosynthesis protein A